MKKIKVRCVKHFINLKKYFNIPLLLILDGGWANLSLYICKKCGELFVKDEITNITTLHLRLCPICNELLEKSLLPYPESIRVEDGEILTVPKEIIDTNYYYIDPDKIDIYELFKLF